MLRKAPSEPRPVTGFGVQYGLATRADFRFRVSKACQDLETMAQVKSRWPLLRWRITKTGRTAMVDCGMIKGKRVRFFYKTMEEAETKAALMRVTRQNEGQVGFDLPVSDRLDAIECLALLRPHGLTLRQAVEFCLKNLNIINCTKTVPEVVNELLIAKEQDGRSKPYLRDLKARLGVFERTINERPIHDVNAHEIDSFLRSLPGGPVNRNNYRRVLGILYSFAVKQRYTLKNPVREVAVANVEVTKPGILTVPEARAMLDAELQISCRSSPSVYLPGCAQNPKSGAWLGRISTLRTG